MHHILPWNGNSYVMKQTLPNIKLKLLSLNVINLIHYIISLHYLGLTNYDNMTIEIYQMKKWNKYFLGSTNSDDIIINTFWNN